MFQMKSFAAAPAFALLLGGTAHAALTADQVWQSWKNAGALVGLTVSAATENTSGGVLTLNGIKIAPEGMGGLTISDMVLTEQSDGSVAITPGADIGMTMTGETEGSIKVTHDGLILTAREADGGLAYDYSAAKLDVVYDSTYPGYSFDGSEPPKVTASGDVRFSNLAGTYSDRPGTNRTFGLDLRADELAYNTLSDDPGMELKQTSTSATQDIRVSLALALPSTIELAAIASPADFGTALKEGLSVSLSMTQGESVGTMKQESPYLPMDLSMKAGGGDASALFNRDTFSIKSTATGLDIESAPGAMPVPVKLVSGPMAFGLTAPVIATEAAGDYGLVLKLSQFSLNEEAWALFDPNGALKRDAADIAIDISGKARMDVPAMIAADEAGGPPAVPQPESLNITELAVKVAGAALAATGAFTFDNSFGMPMPLGEANVNITGANALIDGLIATGLLSDQDAMGARMMMGIFMIPAGDDSLTSKIEAKEGMQILVNGQPLPM
ncbi:DUF2125 domain-containing protein [Rhodobacter calidifons]|uniref:DUF2125 domain-containing protein n=1 Tax=Rhodobacter calidifons TaxID=2715277 RepID=A0ABX0G341_9RHOB|nr:DUF2125 domain-containing protein [Rhodobacter calidifons]NHB75514.1 hypothetical protein [Rhodobacter calidifons]